MGFLLKTFQIFKMLMKTKEDEIYREVIQHTQLKEFQIQ